MPRFVVLSHDWPTPHLDLLVERDGTLKAWRLAPDFAPGGSVVAVENADHRLHYLDYEGPVSGDRGCVSRWDAGLAEWETVETDRIVFLFTGERMRGRYEIVRRGDSWELRTAD